jgi:hypothetical protein
MKNKLKTYFVLLGASKLQENIIKIAKNYFSEIILVDKKKIFSDYTTFEIDCAKYVEIIKILKKNQIKFGYAYCGSEFGIKSASIINKYFNLNNIFDYKELEKLLDKRIVKNILIKNSIQMPKDVDFCDVDKFLQKGKKIVVKPTKLSGSRGVVVLNRKFNTLSKFYVDKKNFLIEDYIYGPGADVNAATYKENFIRCGIADRYFSKGKYRVPLYGNYPSLLPLNVQNNLYKILERAATILNLKDTPLKADFLLKNNNPFLLEVTPRFHGDVLTSNTMYYYSKNNPLNQLFRFISQNKEMKNTKLEVFSKKIICWHSIFFKKKMNRSEVSFFLRELNSKLQLINVYLKKDNNTIINHSDNTSLNGFFWFKTTKKDLYSSLKYIKMYFGKYILCD